MTSPLLTPPDLHQLTGAARAGAQARWLAERGIAHQRDGNRIIVAWQHVNAWLENRPATVSAAPNWGAVNA